MMAMTFLSSPGCGGGERQGKKAAPILNPSAPPFQPPSRQPAHRTFQYAVQPSPQAPPSLLRNQFPHQHAWTSHHPRYISGYYYPRPMVQHPPWNLLKLPLLNTNPRPIALPIRDEGERLLRSVKEDVAVKPPSAVPLYQEKKQWVRKIGCRRPRPGRCSIPTGGSETPAQSEAVRCLSSGVTTLMIRNLPNLFRREDLLLILDKHCGEVNDAETTASPEQWVRSEYDFVYLPFDFRQNMNLGYAFVNFTTPIGATRMSRSFHGFGWKGFSYDMRRGPLNSRKVCEINPAAIQGRAALEHHLGKREYPREEFQPVATLEKPCDGTGRTPLLLVGRRCNGGGWSGHHRRKPSG